MKTVLFRIFLKLGGRRVLIAGGGKIAEEKIYAVLRSATDVTVVAPRVTGQIQAWAESGMITHLKGEYKEGMAHQYFLVIACTDSESVNRRIYEECQSARILCNAVDDPGFCDFYAPAVVSRGDFQIAISTGGHSPALAQQVRKKLEQEFGPEYDGWTGWLGRMRTALRQALPPDARRKELLHLLAESRPQPPEP